NFHQGQAFTDKKTFAENLQVMSWKRVFNKMNLDKYLTTRVMEKINRLAKQQHKVPFTMKNSYVMWDMIWQTREENLKIALVEAVDEFTKHTHGNRFEVEG